MNPPPFWVTVDFMNVKKFLVDAFTRRRSAASSRESTHRGPPSRSGTPHSDAGSAYSAGDLIRVDVLDRSDTSESNLQRSSSQSDLLTPSDGMHYGKRSWSQSDLTQQFNDELSGPRLSQHVDTGVGVYEGVGSQEDVTWTDLLVDELKHRQLSRQQQLQEQEAKVAPEDKVKCTSCNSWLSINIYIFKLT